jgi:hypothetical protein
LEDTLKNTSTSRSARREVLQKQINTNKAVVGDFNKWL